MQLPLIEPVAPPSPLPARTEPWKAYGRVTLYHGDCIEVLRAMPPRSIDACVTDPPYGLGFMGKEWDTFKPDAIETNARKAFKVGAGTQRNAENPNVRGRSRSPAMSPSQIDYDRDLTAQRAFQRWCEQWAREVYRVLRPGGHLLSCGAPRSAHRMISGIEDAGFEIRDGLAWLFGQGFPKSHNLEDGWGTALKPGHEPICVARKPFDGTVEENVAAWGVGALNIEASRLGPGTAVKGGSASRSEQSVAGGEGHELGRWPANVAMDEQAAAAVDAQAGTRKSGRNPKRRGPALAGVFNGFPNGQETCLTREMDAGGASRFFFVAKPSRAERDFGCDALPMRTPGECTDRQEGSAGITPYAGAGRSGGGRNPHPTVKPVALMRWLLRLVVPAGGIVVDPFLGSGTTGMAAAVEGYAFIGMDRELDYLTVSDARIGAVVRELSSRPPSSEGSASERFGESALPMLPLPSPDAIDRQELHESGSQSRRDSRGDDPSPRDRAHCPSSFQETDGQGERSRGCHSDGARTSRRVSGRRGSRKQNDGPEHDVPTR